jgi:Mn2+/Fe2+ NRAMP family transporter
MTNANCPAKRLETPVERKRSAPAITVFGPAIIVAAAGIGASDIIAASVAGARFGLALLWAVALGAALKGVLSEGIARWQVASGTTLLQGVAKHLPPWVLLLFVAYLVVWAVGVSGALANGCGLAIENLSGGRVPRSWGAVSHVLVAAFVVRSGGLIAFTKAMKFLIIAMFITIVYCAVRSAPAPHVMVSGLLPSVPTGAGPFVLSVLGGIGGSVTLLTYNYLPQSQSSSMNRFALMRLDIAVAYTFTALFGMSILLIASRVFHDSGLPPTDHDIISRMAEMLGTKIGRAGFYIYSIGFWAAVVASLLGTWQTVPLLIAECYSLIRRLPADHRNITVSCGSAAYKTGLAALTIAAVPFAFIGRPLALIVGYTVVASLIVPFIAAVLLYLNTRVQWTEPSRRNSRFIDGVLIVALVFSVALGVREFGVVFGVWR